MSFVFISNISVQNWTTFLFPLIPMQHELYRTSAFDQLKANYSQLRSHYIFLVSNVYISVI